MFFLIKNKRNNKLYIGLIDNLKKSGGGFTLVEILLVIAIFGILISFLVPIGLNFYKSQQLEAITQELIQTLRRAQSKAMSVELDSSFGVHIEQGKYILFKGIFYSPDDPSNEVFDLPAIITISGLNEIVFLKYQGIPGGTSAYCGGICTPCNQFLDRTSCLKQTGCNWNAPKKICTGTCTPCNSYQNQQNCEAQSGCSWYQKIQGGDIILSVDSATNTININEIGRVNLQ